MSMTVEELYVWDDLVRCDDAEAYKHVAARQVFNGSVFSSRWIVQDGVSERRYVVSAWKITEVQGDRSEQDNLFTPVLIWEGRDGHGLWYGISGHNAWICNALTSDLVYMEGEAILPLTPKEMFIMRDYGITGVSTVRRGTGISEQEQA